MTFFTTDQIVKLEKSEKGEDFQQNLKKHGFKSPGLIMLIKNTYSFTTLKQMSVQQKQATINLMLQLIYQIPKLETIKSDFFHSYADKIQKLAKRDSKNLTPKFTQAQTQSIKHFFQEEVLPFYQIYQLILDKNPQFSLISTVYDPIPQATQSQIFEGTVVQPQTIDVLKQFVGQRMPKQQKKDPKKK